MLEKYKPPLSFIKKYIVAVFALLFVTGLAANTSDSSSIPSDVAFSPLGIMVLGIFILSYVAVVFEEKIHLRKSKPVLLSAALIWILIAIYFRNSEYNVKVEAALLETFLEYAELFFFLLVAMTYINAMLERGLFEELRLWLIQRRFSYPALFWLTGILAFFLSPVVDNLTTALILCAVVLAVGHNQAKFISLGCINIVVAANAGGAFSPFGDITTLMVWQSGKLHFAEFFQLFLPSVVNYLVVAGAMSLAIPKGQPEAVAVEGSALKFGAIPVALLFLFTIITAISVHNFLHLPAVFGMLMGLAYLKFFGFYLQHKSRSWRQTFENPPGYKDDPYYFDVFSRVAAAEWDTLFFFYGVIVSVGGLGFIGYLAIASDFLYLELGVVWANILVGVLSSLVDNIPVMYAVLNMNPSMNDAQWLLVTLTTGVGGSLLSVGSAAGVALMGQARGYYTFLSHLKWTPVIFTGYLLSVLTHLWLQGELPF